MRPDPDEFGPDAEGLDRVLDLLSATTDADLAVEDPPIGLWDSIVSRLDDEPRLLSTAAPAVGPEPSGTTEPDLRPVEAQGTEDPPQAEVIDLTARRRRGWTLVAGAAAAMVLVAGSVGLIRTREDATQELVASVELEALSDRGTGKAELVEVDGEQRLVVRTEDLGTAPEGTHFEMWLINPDITDMHSLGELPAGAGEIEVPLPAGVDPDEFPIVDINVQQDDEVQHSGVDTSVLRGVLA
jgi:anti-sigma-K factor RskA